MKKRQPFRRVVADISANGIEERHGFRGAREHRELVGEAAQVQFHHDRVMTLLDEEAARFGVQVVTDELEFRLGQAQPVDIIRFTPIGVGRECQEFRVRGGG